MEPPNGVRKGAFPHSTKIPLHQRHVNSAEYLDSKESLLNSIEQQITQAVAPTLTRTLAIYDPSAADEEALGQLNDALRIEIGNALFVNQTAIVDLCMRAYPGRKPQMRSPEQLLEAIPYGAQKSVKTLSWWLNRQSPSNWMRDLIGASVEKVRNSVNSLIEGAVWAMGANTEQITWSTPLAWQWVTRPELSKTGTCPVCAPLDGRVEKRIADFGVPYPVHPRCKCGVVPSAV